MSTKFRRADTARLLETVTRAVVEYSEKGDSHHAILSLLGLCEHLVARIDELEWRLGNLGDTVDRLEAER